MADTGLIAFLALIAAPATSPDWTAFLPVAGAILGGCIAAVVVAWANSWYRDREAKKAEDRECYGLLLLIHGELHHNYFLLTVFAEAAHISESTSFANLQTQVWVSCRTRLAQLLSRDHMTVLVRYYKEISELEALIIPDTTWPAEERHHSISENARSALKHGESAMRYGSEYIFDDPDFEPAVNDAFRPRKP
jgi:hypothetical protein